MSKSTSLSRKLVINHPSSSPNLHNALRDLSQGSQIIAYTDGSTDQKHSSGNSGLGIVITDGGNQTLWTGGLVVRSDGNNFISELAAAAIVVKALPSTLRLTLRSDSLATIGAISKGPISERKRVRAAGRPWLNLCREDLLRKRTRISIEHVFSHRGNLSPEQQGNDLADTIANQYRRIGENLPSRDYFTEFEETFVLRHNAKNIQGDPRPFLKKLEKEAMILIWKEKESQSRYVSKYPTQVMKQSKRVWKWAIQRGFTLFSVSVNGFRSIIESTMKKNRKGFLKNVVSVSQTALRIFGTSTNVLHSVQNSRSSPAQPLKY